MAEDSETSNASALARLNDQLFDAAFGGDRRALLAALDAGAEVDVRRTVRGGWCMTPLCAVLDKYIDISEVGRTACVRALLEAGASTSEAVQFQSTERVTGVVALHDAARNGWYAIVKLLLDAGADVNARAKIIMPVPGDNIIFKTPLLLAALSAKRNQKVIALLLSRGAVDGPNVDRLGRSSYLRKIRAAGSFAAYEKQHRAKLVAMLAPKVGHLLPPELVSVVITFWAPVGLH
mmetsp:Transcript_2256/g.5322  ORF Transcript_2256/g.5322 Transcript_2256/m.5322 type:complete len:235 (-) Transcript_2256:37-741(-)